MNARPMEEHVQEPLPAGEQTPGESPPAPAPEPPPITMPGAKQGMLRRINPLRFFKKESSALYVREGESLLDNHNLAQATMAFQRALSLDPNCTGAFKGLGSALLRKGGRSNYTAALEQYREAVKRNPFDDQAYAVSAKIHEKLGQLKEATLERKKMVIVRTLQSDPNNSIANNNMGILMLQQNQVALALEYFNKSITTNPAYDVAFRNLAATHYRLAKAEQDPAKQADHIGQARSCISRALEINGSVTSMLIQGRIFLLESKFEEALQVGEEAEQLEKANKEVYALKRQALEKLNRTKEAQEAFESYQIFSRQ